MKKSHDPRLLLSDADRASAEAAYRKIHGVPEFDPDEVYYKTVDELRDGLQEWMRQTLGDEALAVFGDVLSMAATLYGHPQTAKMCRRFIQETLRASKLGPEKSVDYLRNFFADQLQKQAALPKLETVKSALFVILEEQRRIEANLLGAVIYGSWVNGKPRPDSDFDLILVEASKKGFLSPSAYYRQLIAAHFTLFPIDEDQVSIGGVVALDGMEYAESVLKMHNFTSFVRGNFEIISAVPEVHEKLRPLSWRYRDSV